MKLTRWELERVLEALDKLIEEQQTEGRSTKNLLRLRSKALSYGDLTGKIRV